MIEIVALEIIDRRRIHACADERIDLVFDKNLHARHHLHAEIFAHHAFAGHRIIRLADARAQQQSHIVERIGREYHQIGRLLHFFAGLAVDIDHAAHFARPPVVNQIAHIGMGAQFEPRIGRQHRQDADIGARLGIGFAAEIFAMAAILALPQRLPLDIRVRGAVVR